MSCWNCDAPLSLIGKLSFRASCEKCHASLHCCCNCTYYKVGLPNDCMVPNTDLITDRAANNFCEEFKMQNQARQKQANPQEIAKKLFHEESEEKLEKDPKKRFDNLFRD